MKASIKAMSIAAIGGLFAGVALAGPGDAYAGYPAVSFAKAGTVIPTIALFRTRVTPIVAKEKAEKPLFFSADSKGIGTYSAARVQQK